MKRNRFIPYQRMVNDQYILVVMHTHLIYYLLSFAAFQIILLLHNFAPEFILEMNIANQPLECCLRFCPGKVSPLPVAHCPISEEFSGDSTHSLPFTAKLTI